jgi:hypothetical protein
MEKQEFFPDAVAYQSIDEDFDPLVEWLDAHPDRDVTEFMGWREVVNTPHHFVMAATNL